MRVTMVFAKVLSWLIVNGAGPHSNEVAEAHRPNAPYARPEYVTLASAGESVVTVSALARGLGGGLSADVTTGLVGPESLQAAPTSTATSATAHRRSAEGGA